jgi:succinate dehydrogenase / fumarate reductase, membrane anchor subunit
MVNRILVGAHYGLSSWLIQRFSAVVMIVYTLVVAIAVMVEPPRDYTTWKALFSQGWMRAATLLFIVSLLLHAWVGMRDVLMDYAKPTAVKVTLELVVILSLVVCAGWAAQILWRP